MNVRAPVATASWPTVTEYRQLFSQRFIVGARTQLAEWFAGMAAGMPTPPSAIIMPKGRKLVLTWPKKDTDSKLVITKH
jgi:hypothetical protein